MSALKMLRRFACPVVLSALSILASRAQVHAVNRYFDVNGTTAGSGVVTNTTYNWEDPFWNTNDATGTTATTNFEPTAVGGDFPRFSAGNDGLNHVWRGPKGGWTFAGVEHGQPPAGACADVKKTSASPE